MTHSGRRRWNHELTQLAQELRLPSPSGMRLAPAKALDKRLLEPAVAGDDARWQKMTRSEHPSVSRMMLQADARGRLYRFRLVA